MIGAQGEWSRVILVRGSAVPVLGTEQVVGGLRPPLAGDLAGVSPLCALL